MGITVTTSDQQITASVGETKIDVSVSGGIGPAGPQGPAGAAGASSWNDITGKPSEFAPSAHAASHSLNGDDELEIEGDQVRIAVDSENASTLGQGTVAATFLHTANATGLPTALPIATANARGAVRIGSGVSIDGNGVISVSTNYAAASHAHGSITSAGAIGTTSGLVLKTGTSGVIEALAQGTAGQVLVVNSGATAMEWKTLAAADVGAAAVSHAHSVTTDITAGNWKIFHSNGSGAIVELALGASGTVLTSNGTANAPTFQAVQGESFHPFLLAGM